MFTKDWVFHGAESCILIEAKEIFAATEKEGNQMSDWKRCPFCGGVPESEVMVPMHGGGEFHLDFSIRCKDCGTYKSVRLKVKDKCNFIDVLQAMEEAEKLWNRRADNGND